MKLYPDWVLAHKTKGVEIRFMRDKYYLYKISSVYDKEKKRARKVTEKYLGVITPTGLVKPKADRVLESVSKIGVKEYGAHQVLFNLNQDLMSVLECKFPNYWKELFIAAIFRLMYQCPFKNMEAYYRQSYLSEILPSAKMKAKNITEILKGIGQQRAIIAEFLREFATGSQFSIVDVTNVISHSENMSKNQLGYNNKRIYDPQVNLFFIFSVDKFLPAYYRITPGNVREVKSFKLSLEESGMKDAVVIGDKGFYSNANVDMLDAEKIRYILPLRRNFKLIDYSKIADGNKKSFDGHFQFEDRVIWHYSYKVDNHRIIVFFDERLKVAEETDYLQRVGNALEGYTMEHFYEKQFAFGTISIITDIVEEKAEIIYKYLKSRMEVETMFDTFKNLIHADRTYMHGDFEIETWMFINYLSLMFYYRFYKLLDCSELIFKYSVKDFLLELVHIKKLKINGNWVTSEFPTKISGLLEKIKVHIT